MPIIQMYFPFQEAYFERGMVNYQLPFNLSIQE